jgi:hypothetical protein
MRSTIASLAGVGAALIAGCGGGGASPNSTPQARLIVPQHSIDRLSLGMTEATVRRLYGEPDRSEDLSESESGNPIVD